MLQYPTNVSPENTAKPADTTKMSFTFNGDRLSYYNIRATKLSTGYRYNIYTKSEGGESGNLPVYNGEEVGMTVNAQYLENGEDYVWQVLLAQRDLAGENPLYDIPVCRGAIRGVGVSDATQIYIDKNLPLYEWGYDSTTQSYKPTLDENDNVLVGLVMEVNGERKFISSYKTGVAFGTDGAGLAVIESAFTSTPSVGDRYQIYANYLISPQYYFMSRATPSLSLTLDYNRSSSQEIEEGQFGLRVTGTYSQAQSSPIKYYTATLYCFTGDPTSTSPSLYEIAKSDKVFSQRINYLFENCFAGKNPENQQDIDNMNYRVIVELVTQDNVTYAAYATMRIEGIDDYAPTSHAYDWLPLNAFGCAYNIDQYTTDTIAQVYRTNLDTGDTVHLTSSEAMFDYKVSTKGNYQYTIYSYDKATGRPFLRSIEHANTKTNFDGYFITALTPDASEENTYNVGDTWKFICDIENTTVLQNLDVVSQVGYSRYPSVSSTELNYMSGTLSGYIGYFNCCQHEYIDDISRVQAWRKFISQPHPFLLKSQKGDVWVVNIVESPKVEYEEDYYKIPTRFTFSWAECANIDDIFVVANNIDMSAVNCSADAPRDEDWYNSTTAEDYVYGVENGEVYIVAYMGNSRQPRVPDTINGKPVTKIKATAFYCGYQMSSISAVWLPSGIQIIE